MALLHSLARHWQLGARTILHALFEALGSNRQAHGTLPALFTVHTPCTKGGIANNLLIYMENKDWPAAFTRERSKVRSLVRPPSVPGSSSLRTTPSRDNYRPLAGARDHLDQIVENNPMHSSLHQWDQWFTPFPKSGLTRRAKQGQDGIIGRCSRLYLSCCPLATDNHPSNRTKPSPSSTESNAFPSASALKRS